MSRRTRVIGIAVIAAYVIAMAVFVVMLERCRNRRPDPSRLPPAHGSIR